MQHRGRYMPAHRHVAAGNSAPHTSLQQHKPLLTYAHQQQTMRTAPEKRARSSLTTTGYIRHRMGVCILAPFASDQSIFKEPEHAPA